MTLLNWLTRRHRLNALEDRLQQVPFRPMAVSRKRALRRRVMARVDAAVESEEVSFEALAEELEQLTLNVEPTKAFKGHTRRYLLDGLAFQSQRVWLTDFMRDLFRQRRFGATVMAGVLLFVVAFGPLTQLPQVSASKRSSVDSVQGVVYVDRDGQRILVENGFVVEPGDVFETEADGWMDVMFVDDSLVSVGPESRVVVEELWQDPADSSSSAIELEVDYGRLSADVVHLSSGKSSFAVTSEGVQFSVPEQAFFDLFVTNDELQLRVFEQWVDFEFNDGQEVHRGTVGPNLQLKSQEALPVAVDPIDNLESLKQEDVWVKVNFQNRDDHHAQLQHYYQERGRQRAGVLPGDVRYWAKRRLEDTRLLLSFNDESRSDQILGMADTRFAEAALLIQQGEMEQAEALLDDYQQHLLAVSAEFSYEVVEPLLNENKRWVDQVMIADDSGDDLYGLREFVDETAVLAASDHSTRSVVQLQTAADRLGLALEFIEIGAYDLAQASLEDYQAQMQSVLEGLPELEIEVRKEVVLEVLDRKLNDLKRLKLMRAALDSVDVESQETEAAVREALEETLYQLNTLVLSLKERAVLELRTFLEDVKGDEVLQEQVLSRLKKTVDLDFEFIQLINEVEALYANEGDEVLILEDSLVVPGDAEEGTLQFEDLPEPVENRGLPQNEEVKEASLLPHPDHS